MDCTDAQLIEAYRRGSQDAFSSLIRRHIDMVYASALRRTGDPASADDVTQAVFIILAKKARRLYPHSTIAGWLLTVTRHVARAAIRSKLRRQHHEHAAARSEAAMISTQAHCEHAEISRVLDDAIAQLSSPDRDAIALRYLQAQTFPDVGSALGISEEAARKRVNRGIHRLRRLLAHHSVFLEAEGLATVMAIFAAKSTPTYTVEAIQTSQTSERAVSLSNEVMHMFLFRQIGAVSLVVALVFLAVAAISTMAQTKPPAVATGHAAPSTQPIPAVQRLVIQMGVTNIAVNIDLFEKMGFHLAAQDANHPIQWTTMESGVVRVRLFAATNIPHVGQNLAPLFWVDGGYSGLQALHDEMVRQHLTVNDIDLGGTPRPAVEMRDGHLTKPAWDGRVIQFTVRTPDGYEIGFVAFMTGS